MLDHIIFVLNKTRLAIVCGWFLLVDACPLFLHFPGSVVRLVTASSNETIDEVGCEVRADEPQPTQRGKSEGDEEGGPKDYAGHADPEEGEYDGGEEGEGDGAEHEGGEEEDRDEGEQQLGDDEGLWGDEWSARDVKGGVIEYKGQKQRTNKSGCSWAKPRTLS